MVYFLSIVLKVIILKKNQCRCSRYCT